MDSPMQGHVELQAASNFSFLRGASHPAELVARASALGCAAIALTDRNTLAGIVRAHVAAKAAGIRFIVGCHVDLEDGPGLLLHPVDRAGYGQLCRLLTIGQGRAAKGRCRLSLADVAAHARGLIATVIPPQRIDTAFAATLKAIAGWPTSVHLAAAHRYRGDDRARIAQLDRLGQAAGTPIVAVNEVLYHVPERRALQDVLTCIREKLTIRDAGLRLESNAERHLKPAAEMRRLFRGFEHALEAARAIAGTVRFSLDELRYEYPDEPVPPGRTAQAHLEDLVRAGAARRYPDGVPDKVRATLDKELALIGRLGYARYFLTVHDIVQFAERQEILCQGRGSAANSAICYVLGITAVDPAAIDLLFERFLSAERREPPDIDVDFEHERREEVIQHIYRRYGREKAGICATVISYRWRSAIREVGKAMGLTEDVTAALARTVWGSGEEDFPGEQIAEAGLDPAAPAIRRVMSLTRELVGFPRHLSQHVGGFVLTRNRLDETVPIGNAAMVDRTFIEWDKDDIDILGILKVDVLGLGMLTCIRKAFALIERHGGPRYELATVPNDDPAVYDMLCKADSLGVFQVESRAQMNMLPRLKPRNFYDLVIEVAIVRPGPIQGDMVHPYLRRRNGDEPVVFPSPSPEHGPPDELERVLGRTKGVPLFQEQAMRIAIEAAKFTPDEANQLRRAMATFRRVGTIHLFRQKMIEGMTARGYDADFAARCFKQIEGFGEYGFPESHAASFARLVYISAWLKRHHPAVFAAALLNAQPMGFYAPAQIVRDAREHGVEARPPDVNASDWDCTLERRADGQLALRLGFRQIEGFRPEWAAALVEERGDGYATLGMLQRRALLPRAACEALAGADALVFLGLDCRTGLWAARGLADAAPLPLFTASGIDERGADIAASLPAVELFEQVIADYQALRLSLKAHPMSFLRRLFRREGIVSCREFARARDRQRSKVAGLVLIRQRPGSAKGVVFLTIEDETGIANIVVWSAVLQQFRAAVMGASLLAVEGQVQRSPEGIMHLVADRLTDRTHEISRLANRHAARDGAPDTLQPLDPPRPARQAAHTTRHPRDARIIPRSRDFH